MINENNNRLGAGQLHSRYNPEAEAKKYINSLELNSNIKCFILIEPGMGYMIPVLKEKFPKSKIIALHVNDDAKKILYEQVPETLDISKIKIIEWRPSMNYFGEGYVKLLSATVNFLKLHEAQKRTTTAFGKRWVKNFFKNLNGLNSVLLFKTSDIPVIITGSGPSLENNIRKIKELQANCLIIAASSSVTALLHFDIRPDIVIATDGGSWALKHLYPVFRNEGYRNINFAVNLCAALPSQCRTVPQLLINDGSLWQNIVLHELGLPTVLIPQRGTVTATAVDLALQLTTGNIYLAGVDLGINDIRTHVKPYAFDNLFFEKAGRLNPVYSQQFIRSGLIKEGGSLDIYAEWFKNQFDIWPKRIFKMEGRAHELGREKGVEPSVRGNREAEKDIFKVMPIQMKDGVEILVNNLTDAVIKELEPLIGEDIENFLSSLRSSRFSASA